MVRLRFIWRLPYESGSERRRWDPHIHAPGTLLNDQFDDDWEHYLKPIETAIPAVEVLGVTDYLCIESYKSVSPPSKASVTERQVIISNVELRLTVETNNRKGINLHLLLCPDNGAHVEQMERALSIKYSGTPLVAPSPTSCSSVAHTMAN